jgi:hypothetical protein
VTRISVFGASQTKEGEPLYQEAFQLGHLLGEAGYTVLTGGYIGTMEAVSRGAFEAGGHVIGITSDEIENFRPGAPNQWVVEEIRFPRLRERILALIEQCDAALVLPGGPGTLVELSTMWNHLLIKAIKPRPLILIGPEWNDLINRFYIDFDEYIPIDHRNYLLFAADVETAVQLLGKLINQDG